MHWAGLHLCPQDLPAPFECKLQCKAGYDEEARYFEEGVRLAKGQELRAQALAMLKPAFLAQLGFLRDQALEQVAAALSQPDVVDTFAASAARSALLTAAMHTFG